MRSFYLLSFCIAILFFAPSISWAQIEVNSPEEESVIDMSPAELQILLEELMQAKKKRLAYLATQQPTAGDPANVQEALEDQNLRQQMDEMEKTLNIIHEKINQPSSAATAGEVDRQALDFLKKQLIGEIQSLKDAFYSLTLKTTPTPVPNTAKPSNDSKEHLVIFATQMMQLRSSLDSLFFRMSDLVDKEEFEQLSNQLDGLETKLQKPIYANPSVDEALAKQWETQFQELKILLENAKQTSTSTTPVPVYTAPIDTEYESLKNLISGTEERIFFETNSFVLTDYAKSRLQQSARMVSEHGRLDILVIGYADEKGSPYYNQELSQKRAESAKKYLMKEGIHPSRIFTQSHGVDYTADNRPAARRADLILLIKR